MAYISDVLELTWHNSTKHSQHDKMRNTYNAVWFANNFFKNHVAIHVELLDQIAGRQDITGRVLLDSAQDNSYIIEMRADMSKNEFFITLMHELIHVWQFERGDLKINSTLFDFPFLIWKDEWLINVPYHQRPSELEAYALQAVATESAYWSYIRDTKPIAKWILRFILMFDPKESFDNICNEMLKYKCKHQRNKKIEDFIATVRQ